MTMRTYYVADADENRVRTDRGENRLEVLCRAGKYERLFSRRSSAERWLENHYVDRYGTLRCAGSY